MNSDAQDYTKDTGRIAAQGNVRVKMGDIDGFGPNCVVVRNDEGQAEKVVFSGRSQINQPGRRWIGDRITMTVVDHKVLAEGNTRAIIVQQQPTKKPEQSPYARPATTPRPQNNNDGSKLADVINQSASSHDDGTQVAAKEPQQKQAEATQ
jgi:lipopolysaccharide export system protein LptA